MILGGIDMGMVKEDDKKFVATILATYTMLILISLCLLLVSTNVSAAFTTMWIIFTLIIVCGAGGAYLLTLLLAFYEKLLGKNKDE